MKNQNNNVQQNKYFNSGFSLVELLVALLIGSLLLLGIIQIFTASNQGAQGQNALLRIQENARIGLEFLARDIRAVDYAGCLANKTNITNIISRTGGFDPSIHEYFQLGAINSFIANSGESLGSNELIASSDVLTLVGARPVCSGTGELVTNTDRVAPLQLKNSCDIPDGSVLLVTNCQTGNIFIKSGGESGIVGHTTAPVVGLANTSNQLNAVYSDNATLLEPYVYTYFISTGANGNTSLFRREGDRNFELITNVRNLQFQFAVDANLDGVAEQLVSTASLTPDQIPYVIGIEYSLALQAESSDVLTERTFTTLTMIRNRTTPNYRLINQGN